jgi:hypothetical protein
MTWIIIIMILIWIGMSIYDRIKLNRNVEEIRKERKELGIIEIDYNDFISRLIEKIENSPKTGGGGP